MIAIVGLGRMGAAMAGRIRDAGFDLALWNRDRSKAADVASKTGGEVYPTPAAATAAADLVLTSLADDAAVESVYLGENGIVSGIGRGQVAVDTSTIDPETVRRVGSAIESAGGEFADCPVSGSVSTVESGSLTIMAGGESSTIAAATPVLDAISARIIPVGALGAGAATKLAVNGLLHGLNVALSEALVLAERAGVDRAIAYEVFLSGAAGAPFVGYKRAAYEHPEDAAVAFSLDLVAKDLELITGLGKRVGAPLAQAETGLEIVKGAIESGMGDRDLSALAVYLREEVA